MSLIVFGSQKGSPGATLTALAVAAAWPTTPGRRKLFLEADPDGGVIAVRYRLGREPGLLSLAAAGRHGINRGDLWSHTQEIPGGLPVVVAPDRPDQATAALTTSGATLGPWLQSLPDVDVIADVGRFSPSSPAQTFAATADLVVMVARPNAEQIQPGAERLKALQMRTPNVGWCLIGSKPYSAEEIEAVHGIQVLGSIADDPRGANALETGASPVRVRRSALVRSAATFAASLAQWLHPEPDDRIASTEPESPGVAVDDALAFQQPPSPPASPSAEPGSDVDGTDGHQVSILGEAAS